MRRGLAFGAGVVGLGFLAVLLVLGQGCATGKAKANEPGGKTEAKGPKEFTSVAPTKGMREASARVTPLKVADEAGQGGEVSVGQVVSMNAALRFVVLDFGVRPMPPLDRRMGVYRGSARVGEVRLSGPVLNGQVAADVVSGELATGDEARPEGEGR